MRDLLYQKSRTLSRIFVMNIVGGIGWAFGVSVGFAALVTIVTAILALIGGVPVIGEWFQGLSDLLQNFQKPR